MGYRISVKPLGGISHWIMGAVETGCLLQRLPGDYDRIRGKKACVEKPYQYAISGYFETACQKGRGSYHQRYDRKDIVDERMEEEKPGIVSIYAYGD